MHKSPDFRGETSRMRSGLSSVPATADREVLHCGHVGEYSSTTQSFSFPTTAKLSQLALSPEHHTKLIPSPPSDRHSPPIQSSFASSLASSLASSSSQNSSSTSVPGPGPISSTKDSQPYKCDICQWLQPDVEQLIEHLTFIHPETRSNPKRSYYCGHPACQAVQRRKDFRRHLEESSAHGRVKHYRCRCGTLFRRKNKFQAHFELQRCISSEPYTYVCACGEYEVDRPDNKAFENFRNHFTPCGRRPKGRPKKR
ncbi:hypothetical protein F5Y14DRAFT_424218 [Nemania sp. NC0429]|nr:hypothetical protein F5Y14DRAFT_424218 [Nemania sp. NC0429]